MGTIWMALMTLLLVYIMYKPGGEVLWTEIHEDVSIQNGVVSIVMGSVNALDITFNEQMWLEIQIDDGQVFDRMMITASPYSLYSKDIEDNSINSDKIADGAVSSEHLSQMDATEGQVLTWDDNWQPSDLPDETDPIFMASPTGTITPNMINSWTAAYGWGDHSEAGYLTEYIETDPIYTGSAASGINANMIASWTTAYSWGDHAEEGYLTEYNETDPIYTGSAASGINANMIASWTTAYSWGDHAEEGYLTEESDPEYTASAASGINANMIGSWNTAYSWGDHAEEGYLTEIPNLGATNGQVLKWNDVSDQWVPDEDIGGTEGR
jgi:hypothetical protein